VARALIVGCGCHGRGLGSELIERGWQVRGTSRDPDRLAEIEAAGIEGVVADPDRLGTILDQIEGVTLIYWLFGAPAGAREQVMALHGPRLERLLEEIVDTPVRGLVYELTTELDPALAVTAFELLRTANERWRIGFEVVDADRHHARSWRAGMVAAGEELLAG
jgi:hypothetical protein